jgi:Flp pilus assembly protein TadD
MPPSRRAKPLRISTICHSLLLLLFASCPRIHAAEHWLRLTTPHFEMYTTNSARQGVAALTVFEQVRYFFRHNARSKPAPDVPVRIIAFRSEKEYQPYRLNGGSFAFYLRTRKADYIVMQDISSEHYQAALHEYTHVVIEHLGLKLPLWLNEGMADLYSSLEPRGNQALVGRPLASRVAELQTRRWLDLNTLFAVNQDSPYYNEGEKMSIFYAESWALTHMLSLSKEYTGRFPDFLAALDTGRSASDCFQSIYGKDLAQVAHDLQAYPHQSSVQAALFDVKLAKTDLEPDIQDAASPELDLALADVLASQQRTRAEASERLHELAGAYPRSPEVEESLGYLGLENGDSVKARESFARAVERGSKDPDVLLRYAQLLRESGAPAGKILPVMQKAVLLKPDDRDALFNLGMTAMQANTWLLAVGALSQIRKVDPGHAFPLFSALAYCYIQLNQLPAAHDMALKARQYARTPDEQMQASRTLGYLDARELKSDANR